MGDGFGFFWFFQDYDLIGFFKIIGSNWFSKVEWFSRISISSFGFSFGLDSLTYIYTQPQRCGLVKRDVFWKIIVKLINTIS